MREKQHVAVQLNWLAKAQEISEILATPHRLFDVDAVRQDSGQSDPVVAMQLIFVEFANTGVRAPLERFVCRIVSAGEESAGEPFFVDLIEGLADLASIALQDGDPDARAAT